MGLARTRVRRAVLLAAALFAAIAAAVWLAHTERIRRAVLARGAAIAASRLGIRVDAARLDYNLLRLDFDIGGLRLSALDSPAQPFFEAQRLAVDLPRSVLRGRLAFAGVEIVGARVLVVRRSDGTTNLPRGTDGTGEPPALAIDRLRATALAVDVTDGATQARLTLTGIDLDVGPDTGRAAARGGLIGWRGRSTPIRSAQGGLRFGGRTATLDSFRVETDDVSLEASGTLDVLVASPQLRLDVEATGDVPRLARWATEADAPIGTVRLLGTVVGPRSAPTAALRVNSDRLSWLGLELRGLASDVAIDATGLQVKSAQGALAGGRVSANGRATFETGDVEVDGSWRALDVGTLTGALAPPLRPRPSSRATGSARLRGRGADLDAWTLDVRTELAAAPTTSSALGVGGTVAVRIAQGRWQAEADGSTGRLPISARLGGQLDTTRWSASSVAGTVTTAGADVATLVATLTALEALPAQTDPIAGTLSASAQISGTWARPVVDAEAAVTELQAQGLSGLAIEATGRGTAHELAVSATLRQAASRGDRNVLSATGTVRPIDGSLDARIEGQLDDLAALGVAPLRGNATVALDAEGPFDALGLTGTVRVANAGYESFALGDVEATVAADPGAVQAEARLERFDARVQARVTRDTRRVHVELAAPRSDIAHLLTDVPQVTGTVGLTATAEGPLDRWESGTASVELTHLDGRVRGLPVTLSSPARLDYVDGIVRARGVDARVGDLRAFIDGRIPSRATSAEVPAAEALRVDVVGDVQALVRALAAAELVDPSRLGGEGPVAVRARVIGALERPVVDANIETGPATLRIDDLPPVTDLALRATLDGGQLAISEAIGHWQGTQVSGDAVVPLGLLARFLPPRVAATLPAATTSATLSVRTGPVTPRVLEPFLSPETVQQLGGSVTAAADLRADTLTLPALRGEVRLDRVDLTVAGLPVAQTEPTRVEIEGGVARVAAWEWRGPESTVRVGGQVDLAGQRATLLVGGTMDLRLLAPLTSGTGLLTTGSLDPRISVVGPLSQPIVEGELVLSRGELRLNEPRLIATDLSALAVLSPTGVRLTRLDGRVNGGTLRGRGDLEWRGLTAAAGGLRASLAGMALEYPAGLRSVVDAELTLAVAPPAGTAPRRARLGGVVTVAQSAYREPMSVVTELLSALRPVPRAAAATTAASTLERLDLDVRVVTDDDLTVRNNLAAIQLGADLRIIGTAATPALSGRATLREGSRLTLGNNRYTIDEGTVNFSNPLAIDPNVDVRAHTVAGGEEIELTVTGTAASLDVALGSTSTPELGEADIASLLLTGRRLEDVPGAEARIVGEQVLGYLSGDVLGVASRVIGLDTVRLGGVEEDLLRGAAAVAAQTDPTSRLTFVKSFGDQWEVTLSQGLRNADQTWIVDYKPRRRLAFRLASRDDSLRSYELRHDVTFGGPARAAVSAGTHQGTGDRAVADVVFEGTLPVPESTLRQILRLSPGRRFDAAVWQIDRDRIEELLAGADRLESRVTTSLTEEGGGVTLTYRVKGGPKTTLHVTGHDLPKGVREAIRGAWRASIADDALRDEVSGLVGRALAEDGYRRGVVRVSISAASGAPDSEKTLRIDVAPGDRVRRQVVRLEPSGLSLVEEVGRAIGAVRLTEAVERGSAALVSVVTSALHERGYAEGRATLDGPSFEGDTVRWTVTLVPGPRFVVGTVAIDGGDAARDRGQRAVTDSGLAEGTTFTPDALGKARTAVVDAYRGAGFTRVVVTPRATLDARTGRASVAFQVTEGRQQVLRGVTIEGNRAVRSREIERALALPVGEPLAHGAWLDARRRIFETGLFSRVDVSTEELPSESDDRLAPVAVRVVVQEWPAVRLRYGLQLSEEWRGLDPLNGREVTQGISADATRRSLFGRAVTLGVAATYRNSERLTRLFASTPSLWGRRIESILSVQQLHTELPGEIRFHRDVAGVSWEQRARLDEHFELSYSYRLERNHTFDPNPPDNPFLPVFDLTEQVARLVGAAAYDTRNDPLNATRGWLVSSSVEYAPEALGSTSGVRFVKSLTQAYYARPWRGTVLASAARAGLARGIGGVGLIPSERFRAGGARSVRGVAEDSLGPRSELFGDVLGGDALLLFNQELRFPVYRWLGGVAFADLGNVFDRVRDASIGDLVGSNGLGLRIATPFGLLRVDYGRLWSPREGQPRGRWSFGIGQAF